jgi:hypothetical protein
VFRIFGEFRSNHNRTIAERKLQKPRWRVVDLNSYALSHVPLCDLGGRHLVALMRFLGMLVGLFGEFVGGQMIRFVVSSNIMSVLRKVVKFG